MVRRSAEARFRWSVGWLREGYEMENRSDEKD